MEWQQRTGNAPLIESDTKHRTEFDTEFTGIPKPTGSPSGNIIPAREEITVHFCVVQHPDRVPPQRAC